MQTRKLLLVALALFWAMAGFGIILPALPYYTESLQGSSTTVGLTVGLLMASYSLVQFVCAPGWGHLSDRLGRRPVFLVGLFGFALSLTLMGLARSLALLFVARILGGMLTAATLPSAFAMVSDLTSEQDRGKGMGIAGAAMGLGFVFGPAIGGVLAHHGDFRLPFFVAGGAALVTLVFAAVIVEESRPAGGTSPQAARPGFLSGLRIEGAGLWPWLVLTFLQTSAFSALEATLALYYRDTFASHVVADRVVHEVGLLMGLIGLVAALFSGGGVGPIIKRAGEVSVVRLGFALFGLGFLGVSMAPSKALMTAALVIVGLGSACMRPSLSAGVSKAARTGQGAALGLMSSCDSLARVFGPLLGGGLFVLGRTLPYFANFGVSLVGLALAVGVLRLVPARPVSA